MSFDTPTPREPIVDASAQPSEFTPVVATESSASFIGANIQTNSERLAGADGTSSAPYFFDSTGQIHSHPMMINNNLPPQQWIQTGPMPMPGIPEYFPVPSGHFVDASTNSTSFRPLVMQEQMYATGHKTKSEHAEVPRDMEALRAALLRQLEYYFSRQNLANDAYLVSQMNSNLFVPIVIIANFKMVKALTTDLSLIVDVLRSSKNVIVDETGTMVKPNIKLNRTTLILRELPEDATAEEIAALFQSGGCGTITSMRCDVGFVWFVSFETEEEALHALQFVRVQTFKDRPIHARIKSETLLKSLSYPTMESMLMQSGGIDESFYPVPPAGAYPIDPSSYSPFGMVEVSPGVLVPITAPPSGWPVGGPMVDANGMLVFDPSVHGDGSVHVNYANEGRRSRGNASQSGRVEGKNGRRRSGNQSRQRDGSRSGQGGRGRRNSETAIEVKLGPENFPPLAAAGLTRRSLESALTSVHAMDAAEQAMDSPSSTAFPASPPLPSTNAPVQVESVWATGDANVHLAKAKALPAVVLPVVAQEEMPSNGPTKPVSYAQILKDKAAAQEPKTSAKAKCDSLIVQEMDRLVIHDSSQPVNPVPLT